MINNELERIWKEVVVAYFEVLSQHLPGGGWKSHEKDQSGLSVRLGQDSNQERHEYEPSLLRQPVRCFVWDV
jgi:hypothetical protein